jgi:repressor LexA
MRPPKPPKQNPLAYRDGPALTYGLTLAQRDCLLVIQEIQRETGICPSYTELQRELDVTSKAAIGRLICSLEERGYLRRIPNCARALEVVCWIDPPLALAELEAAIGRERGYAPSGGTP